MRDATEALKALLTEISSPSRVTAGAPLLAVLGPRGSGRSTLVRTALAVGGATVAWFDSHSLGLLTPGDPRGSIDRAFGEAWALVARGAARVVLVFDDLDDAFDAAAADDDTLSEGYAGDEAIKAFMRHCRFICSSLHEQQPELHEKRGAFAVIAIARGHRAIPSLLRRAVFTDDRIVRVPHLTHESRADAVISMLTSYGIPLQDACNGSPAICPNAWPSVEQLRLFAADECAGFSLSDLAYVTGAAVAAWRAICFRAQWYAASTSANSNAQKLDYDVTIDSMDPLYVLRRLAAGHVPTSTEYDADDVGRGVAGQTYTTDAQTVRPSRTVQRMARHLARRVPAVVEVSDFPPPRATRLPHEADGNAVMPTRCGPTNVGIVDALPSARESGGGAASLSGRGTASVHGDSGQYRSITVSSDDSSGDESDSSGSSTASDSQRIRRGDVGGALFASPALAAAMRPSVPGVRWRDVGGQSAAKASLYDVLIWPLTHRSDAAAIGVPLPVGVLLYGPPGTGKTLLACAAAGMLGNRFITLSIPEVLRPGIGDSERALRAAFAAASAAAPAVIFIDEIQALFTRRSGGHGGDDESVRMSSLLTTQLLQCMDGLRGRQTAANRGGVVVIAATNAPEALDDALFRPGRFDRAVHVGLPDVDDRTEIILPHLRRLLAQPSGEAVDAADGTVAALARYVAERTDGYSGADLVNICRVAVAHAIQECDAARDSSGQTDVATADGVDAVRVTPLHVQGALLVVQPSCSSRRVQELATWRLRY